LSKVELGLAIGKSQRGYVMIKDKGIAKRIIALLEEMEEGAYDEDENL
jgi:ribosomal protein L7Ae-like RNA K-turn-binding protein